MIVDCYTCIWESSAQLGCGVAESGALPGPPRTRAGTDPPQHAGVEQHQEASKPVDASIVLAFKSDYLGAEVPNRLVSDYVRRYPDRLIGFAGVDPTKPAEAVEELRFAHAELGMRGVSLSPAAQNFHPCHTNAKTCYEAANELDMPVLFHTGFHTGPQDVMQYAQPSLLDEVAREFPSLKIIVAHLGFPWVNETLVLLAKHSNVHSDVSWLLHQPWQAYQALLNAHQYGVMDKLLFGSGFPYASAAHAIEALYGINQMVSGTHLPAIPREQLRGIVERDALGLLGIQSVAAASKSDGNGDHLSDDDL